VNFISEIWTIILYKHYISCNSLHITLQNSGLLIYRNCIQTNLFRLYLTRYLHCVYWILCRYFRGKIFWSCFKKICHLV